MRKFRFINGEFYHIYNRGTDKRIIYSDPDDFERFLQSIQEFNTKKPVGSLFENSFRNKTQLGNPIAKLVDIVSYCLNPNHYHLILRQLIDNGVSEFMRRIGTGYTQAFNIKYKRSGVLFQGKFKALHIDSNEYLLHLSAYVNLNNQVHRLGNRIAKSSWEEYLDENSIKNPMCRKEIILEQFKNINEYKNFAESSLQDILMQKSLSKELEKMLLE